MMDRTKDTIPVFEGRGNVTVLDTQSVVLSFGNSKIFPTEFHLKVRAHKNATLEEVEEKIEEIQNKVYGHFMGLHNVHFTTRRQYWRCFAGDSEDVFQATVSATHVHIISALDEHNSLYIKA